MPEPGSPSLAARALLAVALTACFYLLAIAVGLGLVAIPVVLWVDTGHVSLWLTAFCLFTGLGILWSIVPRPARFEPPGPRVTAADHPALLAELQRVASDTGHPLPDEIYLAGDVNAAVTEVGPWWRRRRVLILGLPLVQALTVSQVRAVIAHELAHYIGGDTRFGNWIWRTRAAIGRTLHHLHDEESLSRRLISKPFEWYAILFSRITAAVSRRQEFAADAVAARVAGSAANLQALRRIHRVGAAHAAFLDQEVGPVVGNGFRPPLAEGFDRFLSADDVRGKVDTAFAAELEQRGDPHDSHPTLSERLAAIEALGGEAGEEPDDGRSALELIPDLDADEAATLRAMVVGMDGDALAPIGWDDVVGKVVRPLCEEAVTEQGAFARGVTVGGAADVAIRLAREDEAALFTLSAAVTLTLERAGFTLSAPPGEPVRCTRGGESFAPFADLVAQVDEEARPGEWRARCERAGVAGAELYVGAPADEASARSRLSSSEPSRTV